jgi:acylphosphatase
MTTRFLVEGLVQGVGFRYFVARRAGHLGLVGRAENLADGRVEVVVRGPGQAIDALEVDLQQGPGHAKVQRVTREDISDEMLISNSFIIK